MRCQNVGVIALCCLTPACSTVVSTTVATSKLNPQYLVTQTPDNAAVTATFYMGDASLGIDVKLDGGETISVDGELLGAGPSVLSELSYVGAVPLLQPPAAYGFVLHRTTGDIVTPVAAVRLVTITTPTNGAAVNMGQALMVDWTAVAGQESMQVVLQSNGGPCPSIAAGSGLNDTGMLTVSAGLLSFNVFQQCAMTLEVTREQTATIGPPFATGETTAGATARVDIELNP